MKDLKSTKEEADEEAMQLIFTALGIMVVMVMVLLGIWLITIMGRNW